MTDEQCQCLLDAIKDLINAIDVGLESIANSIDSVHSTWIESDQTGDN